MEEIIDRLYVGDDADYTRTKDKSNFSFLRCCKEGPSGHRDLAGYRTPGAPKGDHYLLIRKGNTLALNMIDVDDPSFVADEMVKAGLQFIKERLETGDKVLVACNRGHSRGPVMALLYLRSVGELPQPFLKAEHIFRTLYRKYDPGKGTRQWARSHWREYENILRG